ESLEHRAMWKAEAVQPARADDRMRGMDRFEERFAGRGLAAVVAGFEDVGGETRPAALEHRVFGGALGIACGEDRALAVANADHDRSVVDDRVVLGRVDRREDLDRHAVEGFDRRGGGDDARGDLFERRQEIRWTFSAIAGPPDLADGDLS